MKIITIDIYKLQETFSKNGRSTNFIIKHLEVYENFIYLRRNLTKHPFHKEVEGYIFPKEHIYIHKFHHHPNLPFPPSEIYKYYVDTVFVSKRPTGYFIEDLYLDFILTKDGNYIIEDVDEYRDAISHGQLNYQKSLYGLDGLDNILKAYYEYKDLEPYIEKMEKRYKQKHLLKHYYAAPQA